MLKGVTPVIAHPERYRFVLSDLSLVRVNTSPPLLEMRYTKFLSDNYYADYTPLSKIEDMRVITEKLLITHGGSYPKINLQKFCNNKL